MSEDFFDCGPASFYNYNRPEDNRNQPAIQAMSATEVSRLCPVCGRNRPGEYIAKGGLRLVRCHRCSMVYVNPAPAEFASGRYYGDAASYYLSPAKLESDYSEVRFPRELALFRKHCQAGTVLDVGCSTGGFLFQLGRLFPGAYKLLGTDVSGPPLDYAESRGVPVIRGNFLEREFGANRFHAVTFWAVIEHLLEPRQFLEKARAILAPDGLCFVLVPNLQSLAARLLGSQYRYIYPQHLNYFTRRTLTKLVEADFSIVEFRSMHFNPIVIWQDWRQGGRNVSNEERARLLKKTTAYKEHPAFKPARTAYRLLEHRLGTLNLADNIAVVLRKKR